MGKQLVRLTRLNWDQEYLMDIYKGNGFLITEPAIFQLDESKQKSLYGAKSPLYGTNYEDETAFIERYRCQCGEYKGKLFENMECPLCHTKVKYEDINIQFTGWISLGNNFIINPYWYNLMDKCLGKDVLDEIVTAKTSVDVDGHLRIARPDEWDCKASHPYAGIGLIEFRKRFEEIMKYFRGIKKKKESEFDTIIGSSSSVFASKIPIYSTFLRPQSTTCDSFYYNSIDKQINPLFNLSEKIKSAEEIDKIVILDRMQKRANAMWDENFSLLNGKEGWIRGQLLGGSLNTMGDVKQL